MAAVSVVCSAVLPGRQPFWRVFAPGHYRASAAHDAGTRAIAAIPDDASVIAQNTIVPHLSQREDIHLLERDAPEAEYVITSDHLSPWPLASNQAVQEVVQMRWGNSHVVVFDENGWVVRRRMVARPEPYPR
jgi:hypothetical protein